MIKEAIDCVVELAAPKIFNVSGISYATSALVDLPSPSAQPRTLDLHTLQGLVDLANSDVGGTDYAEKDGQLIVIESPVRVSLCSSLYGEFEQRDTYAASTPFLPTQGKLGNYMPVEEFIVRLQAGFVASPTTRDILQVLGNMQGSSIGTVQDDGVSQTVATRRGVTKLETVALANPVELRPYRTFQEIEQPASRYVLRLRGNGEELPQVALFEAEDNQWQLEAINSIKAFLSSRLSCVIVA